MAVASVDDVATSLGRPITGTEEEQVEMWLGDAELQIRLRLGPIAGLDQEVVAYVEREAVAARVRNPEGYQYEAIDDYRYGLPAESRRVAILDEWWDMLAPAGSTTAFSIRAGGEVERVEPDMWISTTEHL
jgi:hypothetical protein